MNEKYLWAVEVTEPPGEKHPNWARPARYMVVAVSMEEAMKLTREAHQDITFVKILKDRHVDDVLIQ